MSFNPEEIQEILSIYKAESEEHLQKLNQCLLLLEKEPARGDVLEEVFREAHSLKGSARMIGFATVEKLAHGLEDLFGAARKGELTLGAETFDVIFKTIDAVSRVTEAWLADPSSEGEGAEDLLALIKSARSGGTDRSRGGKGEREPRSRESLPKEEKREGEKDDDASAPAPARSAAAPAAAVEGAPGKEARKEKVGIEVEETIRVATQKLDDLMNRIGEILVTKIKFDQRLEEVRRLHGQVEDLHRAWADFARQDDLAKASPAGETIQKLGEMKRENGEKIASLAEEFGRLAGSFNEDSLRLTLISSELQEAINRVRMLPLSSLFNLFPRLLRDIAREGGKEVELHVTGGGIQLDKKIIEELKDPMMHLLRNSIDHGIEPAEERAARGKKPAGAITIKALQRASSVLIEIEDDGEGMDPEKISATALRRGFVTEEQLGEMTEQQTMALVFAPGFTTKGIITDISGRGVGLDVVYSNIERIKGTITLDSHKGRGTKFSIKIPVTLATTQSLVVRVDDQVFAIPLTAVETILEVGLDDVMTLESREAILVGGTPTALVRLHEILGIPAEAPRMGEGTRVPAVVVGSADEKVALTVSEVIGEKEIVVKGLGPQLRRVRNISGASVMGDGSVVLILNVFDLVKSSQRVRGLWVTGERKKDEAKKKPEILVADDSVTTRVLEKNILEGGGYSVTLAVDGADALEQIKSRHFDLVVSDVEMPRMNGFELTAQLRKSEKHRTVPVILVTSLDSEEDRKRGIEAGADAYLTKGAFEQGNLLSTIRQLL